MRALAALSGGVMDTGIDDADLAELRQLVNDIGARHFTARTGQRSVAETFDKDLWRHLDDTGLSRLTTTTELNAGPVECAVLLSGLARQCASAPVAETDLMAAWLADRAGLHVPLTGPLTVAVARGRSIDGRLTGTAQAVPWASSAEAIILAVDTPDGLYVGSIAAPAPTSGHDIGGEPRQSVPFDVATADTQLLEIDVSRELVRRGAWARCVQVVGALDAAAVFTADHTANRVQFGQPLRRFQSVQHALAGMAGHIERARTTVALAVAAADQYGFASAQTDYAVTLAKVNLGMTVRTVSATAHQLHGAIGVTLEHPLRLATMRAHSWIGEFGSTDLHRRRLGRAATTPATQDFDLATWDLIIGTNLVPWVTTDAH